MYTVYADSTNSVKSRCQSCKCIAILDVTCHAGWKFSTSEVVMHRTIRYNSLTILGNIWRNFNINNLSIRTLLITESFLAGSIVRTTSTLRRHKRFDASRFHFLQI